MKKNTKEETNPVVTVEPGAFVSVVRCLPMELLGNIHIIEYLIHINIENMLYRLWENFYIAYIIFCFIWSGDSL